MSKLDETRGEISLKPSSLVVGFLITVCGSQSIAVAVDFAVRVHGLEIPGSLCGGVLGFGEATIANTG